MVQVRKELGEVLFELGLVTEEQMQDAAQHEATMGQSGWKMLLETGVLDERDLVKGKAAQADMPFADLRSEVPTPEALALIPGEVASRQLALPLRLEGGSLVLAMVLGEPGNHIAALQMSQGSGREVRSVAAYRPDLLAALDRAYGVAAAGSPVAGGPPGAPGNGSPAPPAAPASAPPAPGASAPGIPPAGAG
ncbi:MAG: hypothetical protein M3360_11600, partial [Actinomycetota bacterium]|nr:hypothetical protein [Actinomycetota bacterium]